MVSSGIYKIENTKNGKVYIGSAVDLEAREKRHFRQLRKDKHHNVHLQNSFNKYGKKNFVFSVLEFCDKDVLYQREQEYINSFPKKFRYNIAEVVHSPMLGIKHTKEARQKISKANSGTGNGMFNIPTENHSWFGRKHTEETKLKISKANSGENHPFYGKRTPISRYVMKVEKETGRILNFYSSMHEAMRETGVAVGSISRCCLGKQKTAGGYMWMFPLTIGGYPN